jgi:hypothetical protein
VTSVVHVNLVWIAMNFFSHLFCALCSARSEVSVILAVRGSGFASSHFLERFVVPVICFPR